MSSKSATAAPTGPSCPPTVCRNNRALGREYCEKCPGLADVVWIDVKKPAAPPPFHEALRSAMAAKGWIGSMLVEKSGLPSSSLYFYLQGKKLPTLGNVQVLDQVLGTNFAVEYKEMLEKARPPVALRPPVVGPGLGRTRRGKKERKKAGDHAEIGTGPGRRGPRGP
jgi:hypothetical protein